MNSKTKVRIAIVGFFLSLFLCYVFAISKTLTYRKDYNSLKKEIQRFKDMSGQWSILTQKEQYYDSLQQTFQIAETSFQNNILRTLTKAAEAYTFNIIDFNAPHLFEKNEIQQNSYSFTVEGSFMSILKLIHHLEQRTKLGEIIHCSLEKKKAFRTQKERLQARIIIQHVN
ncbi:MAG: hypothetical protein AAF934_12055 [Bacteroidota bacterium]